MSYNGASGENMALSRSFWFDRYIKSDDPKVHAAGVAGYALWLVYQLPAAVINAVDQEFQYQRRVDKVQVLADEIGE